MIRKSLLLFFLSFFPFVAAAQEEDSDFCMYNSINVSKSFNDKWGIGLLSEHRVNNKLSSTEQFLLRPRVNYNLLPWMSLTMQVDFAWYPSGFRMRCLPQIQFTESISDWTFSLRLRDQVTWKSSDGSFSSLIRTKGQVNYKIPESIFQVHVAAEPYFWDKMNRCRFHAGVDVSLSDQASVIVEYVRQEQYQRLYDDNILWIILNIKL